MNPSPNIKNLKPFKKGKDPRRNLEGRPLIIPPLKEALAKLLNEDNNGLDEILQAIRRQALKGDTIAAKAILERAYGLPKQTIDMAIENRTPTIRVITTDGENFIKRQYERLDTPDGDGVRE